MPGIGKVQKAVLRFIANGRQGFVVDSPSRTEEIISTLRKRGLITVTDRGVLLITSEGREAIGQTMTPEKLRDLCYEAYLWGQREAGKHKDDTTRTGGMLIELLTGAPSIERQSAFRWWKDHHEQVIRAAYRAGRLDAGERE